MVTFSNYVYLKVSIVNKYKANLRINKFDKLIKHLVYGKSLLPGSLSSYSFFFFNYSTGSLKAQNGTAKTGFLALMLTKELNFKRRYTRWIDQEILSPMPSTHQT